MSDAGGIFSFTTFWVCVAVIVIGWPVAIWLRRRRIAWQAYQASIAPSLGLSFADYRAHLAAFKKLPPYSYSDDCFFRGHGRATPDDLREGM